MKIKDYLEIIKVTLVIGLFYGILHLLGITCPIKFMSGISCPGCGMTRAWLSFLFRQDIRLAFSYHPLFWIVPPCAVLLLFQKQIPKKAASFCLYLTILLFLLVYAWRLYDQTDTVVVFHPQDGLIVRLVTQLYHLITG